MEIQINYMVPEYIYSPKRTWHQAAGDSEAFCDSGGFYTAHRNWKDLILHIESESIWYNRCLGQYCVSASLISHSLFLGNAFLFYFHHLARLIFFHMPFKIIVIIL